MIEAIERDDYEPGSSLLSPETARLYKEAARRTIEELRIAGKWLESGLRQNDFDPK